MTGILTGMRRLAAGVSVAATAAMVAGMARAEELLGQPTDGAIGLQTGASPIRHQAEFFHNAILMPIITGITLLVLVLLVVVMVRFNKRANPVPARFTHNTMIEVLWTTIPVLILMFIAIFSFRLLFAYHNTPPVDVTV